MIKHLGCCVQVGASLLMLIACGQLAMAQPAKPASQPGKDGWLEIDQRLVFLTIQLSTIESSIEATNKALKVAGYKKLVQENAAENAKLGNEIMDRRGGGPVPWQEFYGKTAEKFFYNPRGTILVNPTGASNRPPQFDYIYRANEQARARAEEEAGKLGNKIDDLLSYRRQLEAEQSALWCKIALRGISSMELSMRPMYRLDLAGPADDAGKQQLEAVKAAAAFLKAIDAEVTQAQKGLDDQKTAVDQLVKGTGAARLALSERMLKLPAMAAVTANPKSNFGQLTRLAKRLEDGAQNLADALRLAADAEAKDDQASKRNFRGYFQQMVFDYASTFVAADRALVDAATEWKIVTTGKIEQPAPPVKPVVADDPGARLDAAKVVYQKEISDARKALVAAIDARLNAAADAGDLTQVQAFQAAKIKAATDGSIPDAVKDPAVLAAKKTMDDAVAAAQARLVAVYRQTISEFTKARKFTEAQAIQEELNASGLPVSASPEVVGPKPVDPVKPVGPDALVAPNLPKEGLEVELPAPVDDVIVGGAGRYIFLHLKKLQQLGVFDVSQAKVIKYLPLPSNDIEVAAGLKKFYIGVKDLRKVQRWDIAKLELELTVPAPEGGIGAMATGAAAEGPVLIVSGMDKRFWILNPMTLKAEPFPSKNWGGGGGGAWGPTHVHVSFDGSSSIACGGGWAGIEVGSISNGKVTHVNAGSYVNGDALIAGNGSLVFPDGGGIVRSDLASEVKGIEGKPFPAHDPGFSLAYRKDKDKGTLVVFANGDPRPLVTLRNLPELGADSKLPIWQRVNLIPRAKTLLTVGKGADHLILRKFDLAEELEAEGIDYLFVESAPPTSVVRGRTYSYQLQVRSKKGNPKIELQSGPKGMTVNKKGLVEWTVPLRTPDKNATVIIQISDGSGQTIFHSFGITITDLVPRK